jgi:hypothetical protein
MHTAGKLTANPSDGAFPGIPPDTIGGSSAAAVENMLHWSPLYYRAAAPRKIAQRHKAVFGSLLLRWAVSVVGPRYKDVRDGV